MKKNVKRNYIYYISHNSIYFIMALNHLNQFKKYTDHFK